MIELTLYLIGTLIGIPCMVLTIQSTETYQNMVSRKIFDRKPFTCALCMTFWTALAYNLTCDVSLFRAVLMAFISAMVAEYIYAKL